MAEISVEGSGQFFACARSDTLLAGGLRAGLGMPYECTAGACGTCKFELLEGDVEVLWDDAPGLSTRDRAKNRKLACQCRPLTDCRIKMRFDEACRPLANPCNQTAMLIATNDITHDIREFRFATGTTATFLPGQFATLQLPGVRGTRAYSMSNLPNDEGEWHFQVRRVHGGSASNALFDQLRVGDQITLDGPFGMAFLREGSARDVVCIAGGSGLAPMVSIARSMASTGQLASRRLHFFYGARTQRDVCGEALLESLPGFGERIRFYSSVSSTKEQEDPCWSGRVGFIHEYVAEVVGANPHGHDYYMAGPPPMIQAVLDTLQKLHKVDKSQIYFDRFF
ncbi:2Fe-2S iron-sulfur cluster-binding protein [Ottowia thiooxydans]|uniref:Toluene monooxygenase electron transfer component n=1 Tax=Ottowia thiooxydans TaxID=219182 RepID=A0ABV2QDD0_9BURK